MSGCLVVAIPLLSSGLGGYSYNNYSHLWCPNHATYPITYLEPSSGIRPWVDGWSLIDDTYDSVSPSPKKSVVTSWTDGTSRTSVKTVNGKTSVSTTSPKFYTPSTSVAPAAPATPSSGGAGAASGGSETGGTGSGTSSNAFKKWKDLTDTTKKESVKNFWNNVFTTSSSGTTTGGSGS